MRQTLKRIAKMAVGYGAVQWAGLVLSLVFTPIITRILTPADYGAADYLLTIAAAVGTAALFALPQALMTHFNDQPQHWQWQRRVTGSALALVLLVGLPVSGLLLLLAPQFAAGPLKSDRYVLLLQLIGATTIFSLISAVLTAAAQAALRVRWGMLFSLTTIVMSTLGNVLFIILLRLGVTGMVLTPILTSLAVCVLAAMVMRQMVGRPSLAIMKVLFRSGTILLPTMMAAWALQVIDRLFLVRYVSLESLGQYAIANKIAGLLYVALAPVYSAWTPLALSIQHDPTAKQQYANMARYLIGAALIAALGLGLFATEILIVLTRVAYLPAAPYVGVLTYVHVLAAIGTVLATGAMAGKQLPAFSWAVVTGAVVNIALNFVLIPSYGVWGATIATVVGYAVPQVILYVIVQRRYHVPYPTALLLEALLAQGCLLIIGLFIPPLAFPIRVGLKLILFGLLPVVFLWLGVVTRFEVQQAGLYVRNLLRRTVRPNAY
jgi:O-antigen/teichoic acid export membrane protein